MVHAIVLGTSTRAFGFCISAEALEGGSHETMIVSFGCEEEWMNSIWNR